MSTEMVFYMSMVLLMISFLGLQISSDAISVFVARQIMVASAIINSLNFSLRVIPRNMDIRVMLVLGLLTFYLLEFAVIYYIYTNTDDTERKAITKGYRFLSLEKSDWWGEDKE